MTTSDRYAYAAGFIAAAVPELNRAFDLDPWFVAGFAAGIRYRYTHNVWHARYVHRASHAAHDKARHIAAS